MKKTKEEIDNFISEIIKVCEKHRLGIIGTCNHESIYGEITIVDLDDVNADWHDAEAMLYNFDT